MTTLIEDLQALLNPLSTGGSHYAVNETEPPPSEYIVFFRVVSDANVSLDGPSDVQGTRVQVDIFARQISRATAIESALEAAMNAWAVQNVQLTSQDLYEDAVKLHRITKDYTVWSAN